METKFQFFKDQVANDYSDLSTKNTDWNTMWSSFLWNTPDGKKVEIARLLQQRIDEAAERFAMERAAIAFEEGYSQKESGVALSNPYRKK